MYILLCKQILSNWVQIDQIPAVFNSNTADSWPFWSWAALFARSVRACAPQSTFFLFTKNLNELGEKLRKLCAKNRLSGHYFLQGEEWTLFGLQGFGDWVKFGEWKILLMVCGFFVIFKILKSGAENYSVCEKLKRYFLSKCFGIFLLH